MPCAGLETNSEVGPQHESSV